VAVLASRVLGVAREVLFAGLFGPTWVADAFVIAFRIPNLLRDLFAEGALSSAFVPTFTEAFSRDGRERAFQLASRVLTGTLLATSLVTVAGILFAGPLTAALSDDFRGDPAGQAMLALLTRIMMPTLALISISAVFMGMLNSQRRFTAPAYAPALFNLTAISAGAGLWLIGARGERGVVIWALAHVAAAAVQAACQLPGLWRLGYRPKLLSPALMSDPGVRRILRLMGPASIGLAAVQVNVLVNTHFAARLQEGTQVLLQCSFRLFYLPIGVFGVALAVVTTTQVADEAARGDRAALRERTAEGGRGVWMLAAASAVGLIVLAEPVVTALYQRGLFTHADTLATVPILRAYMLGVLPYSLVKIYVPAFYALGHPRVPMLAALAAVAANVAWSTFAWQRFGAPGLAFGTTLAALVNCLVLRVAFGRLVGPPRGARWLQELGALVVSNAVLGLVAWAAWRAGVWLLADPAGQLGWLRAGLWLGPTIAAGFLAYALVLRALRYPGAEVLLSLPARFFGRLVGRAGGRSIGRIR
jgi:putative peptidoglycan lipid II flippase